MTESPLADWSDAEIYSVWRATDQELLRALRADHTDQADHADQADQAAQTSTAAEARRYLLAEIERRYPRETAAWLKSDAVLSGGAPDFLKPGRS
jgi:hypothetical protein